MAPSPAPVQSALFTKKDFDSPPANRIPARRLARKVDPDKPPRVLPNTYWLRKGSGWVLEYKRKVRHKWLYEYFGLLDLDTWNQLKGSCEHEKLANIIKGIILAKRAERERAQHSVAANHRLRLVGKGR
jgi:hypothetical protein